MTGLPDYNRPAFFEAERQLIAAGYEVINPARNGLPVNAAKSAHMKRDLEMLLTADAVALLPGWMDSHGANLERNVAYAIGLDIDSLATWLDFRREVRA
jgi:hypothetical protein